MSIRRWSKIFALGDTHTDGLFSNPISVTEKVDGSQFNFGVHPEHGLMFLTKGSTVHLGDNNKLFAPAVQYVHSVESRLKEGYTYHGETLSGPRQNTLVYDHPPTNHIALYGVTKPDGSQVSSHDELSLIAMFLGIDVVPEFFHGVIDPQEIDKKLAEWLDRESYLGKEKIEGVVLKNYHQERFIGGVLVPLIQAKYVSERFKERHKVAWPDNNKSPLVKIGEIVRTEARWMKAIQKLKESGEYVGAPKDIGGLMKNLHIDIEEEDKEHIKEQLWSAFSKDIKRAATRGFPEWYKEWLVKEQMERASG